MARARKPKPPPASDDEVRQIILEYFFHRNKTARSRFGKKTGAYLKETDLKRDLKASHNLTAQQVTSNLTYLLSMGWVEEARIEKRVRTRAGTEFPATTVYYVITAEGIDKIMGPSQFTKDRFHGIKIEAAGQNIITLGDGNQINAKFQNIGEQLSEFKEAVRNSDLSENDKVNIVMDIETIQVQLAKPEPNKGVIASLWDGIIKIAAGGALVDYTTKITPYIYGLIQ